MIPMNSLLPLSPNRYPAENSSNCMTMHDDSHSDCYYTNLLSNSAILFINLIFIVYFNTRKDIECKHALVLNIHLVTLSLIIGLSLVMNHACPSIHSRNKSHLAIMLITTTFLLLIYGALYSPKDEYFINKCKKAVYYKTYSRSVISCCFLNIALIGILLKKEISALFCR